MRGTDLAPAKKVVEEPGTDGTFPRDTQSTTKDLSFKGIRPVGLQVSQGGLGDKQIGADVRQAQGHERSRTASAGGRSAMRCSWFAIC